MDDFDRNTDAIRESADNIHFYAYELMQKLTDARKDMVRIARKPSERKLLARHGYNISDAEIELVAELDKKGKAV